MRSALGRGVVVLAFASLVASCAKYTTYSFQHKMSQEFTDDEDPEPPPVEARQLLAGAKTVAFYPPDACVNSDPMMERKKLKELRASCGVLMSALERSAQSVGYEVLSWQNLRGHNKRPIDYAREGNVDVLFEINEFESGALEDYILKRQTNYFRHGDDRKEILVADNIKSRCRAYSRSRFGEKPEAATATIDIKTVAVNDGRDRWHYRKTRSHSWAQYPEVKFKARHKANKLGSVLGPLGIVSLIGGGTLLVVEQVSKDNPLTPQEDAFKSGFTTPILVVGALALAAGIVLEVKVGGAPPTANETLCLEDTREDEEAIELPPPTLTRDATSSEQIGDPVQRSAKAMLDEMVKEFTEELRAAKASRPAAPATPATPPTDGGPAPSLPPPGTPPAQP